MTKQRIRIFVTGKVQGVFFRQALKVMAKKNDVFGWVKNLKDGRVEAVLEGEVENVSRLIEWAHGGPANARVEDVEIINEKFTGEFSKFDVLY
ncbi:acylphosphatase [Nitrosopumilus sp. K4]|uniref:acylphosphatase n=1 Tax=Nitrosopumilus sp. K4 TaxID=2795383 RepID=UPI001BA5453A|nr:acylphosphatase [Nitrosopumilus sp. K4]QUC64471.1 acylphosphatase [Nitrosopumilus sp. K4]